MKLQKILNRFLRLHPKEIDLSLDRINRLTKDLGYPQDKLNIISVIGTNGKFSTAQILKSILNESGYKCDLYTSPHIKKINERFVFSDKEISNKNLYNLLKEVEVVNKKKPITFFEICTAAFFLGASRSKSDVTILESGLFHRFDACSNIKKNIASIITAIGLDHLDWLPKKNRTINRIIFEKTSNLLKSKIIIGQQPTKKISNQIKKIIKNNKSEKIFFGENYNYSIKKKFFIYGDNFGKIKLPMPNLLGEFQLSNATNAIAALRNIDKFNIKNEHIKRAITKVKTIARLQEIKKGKLKKLSKNNKLLLDGSHNPLGASVISKYLNKIKNKKIYLIVGMMNNKNHKSYFSFFRNKVESITTIDIPNQQNSMKKEKLNKIIIKCGIKSNISNDINDAIKNISKLEKNSIILITGSLYLAGEMLNRN